MLWKVCAVVSKLSSSTLTLIGGTLNALVLRSTECHLSMHGSRMTRPETRQLNHSIFVSTRSATFTTLGCWQLTNLSHLQGMEILKRLWNTGLHGFSKQQQQQQQLRQQDRSLYSTWSLSCQESTQSEYYETLMLGYSLKKQTDDNLTCEPAPQCNLERLSIPSLNVPTPLPTSVDPSSFFFLCLFSDTASAPIRWWRYGN